jgi:hypothetical protein
MYEAMERGEFFDGEAVAKLWATPRDKIYSDSVNWLDVMKWEWTMKPHYYMANYRFYNYPYVFAQLLVFTLYPLYKEHVSPFRLAGPLCDGEDVFFDMDGEATMNILLKKIPGLQKYRRKIRSLMVRLPRHRLFPKSTKPDDIIAFLDVGAYTLEQMSQYNGRQRSGVIMITADRTVKRIRRKDSMLDLLINDLMWA